MEETKEQPAIVLPVSVKVDAAQIQLDISDAVAKALKRTAHALLEAASKIQEEAFKR